MPSVLSEDLRLRVRENEMKFTANWKPLEARLSPKHCSEFMWMFRENGVEHYKHIITRSYLLLTGDSRCVVRRENAFEEANFDQEWNRVTGRSTGDVTARADE